MGSGSGATRVREVTRDRNVVHWVNSADGLVANIECRNGSGQFVDTRHDVLVIE